MDSYQALRLSPMIPSHDIAATCRFFTDLLRFEVVMSGNYSILVRGNVMVHVLAAGKDIGEMECYLEVDDVDGLWASIKSKVTNLKVRTPFDRDYGMREFHIVVPQTNTLLFVGQFIGSASGASVNDGR